MSWMGKICCGSNANVQPETNLIGKVPFSYNSPSPVVLVALLAGDCVDEVDVKVETIFDDPLATVSVGTFADVNKYLSSSDVNLQVLCQYNNESNDDLTVADTLILTINPGTSTQGDGYVMYKVRR